MPSFIINFGVILCSTKRDSNTRFDCINHTADIRSRCTSNKVDPGDNATETFGFKHRTQKPESLIL